MAQRFACADMWHQAIISTDISFSSRSCTWNVSFAQEIFLTLIIQHLSIIFEQCTSFRKLVHTKQYVRKWYLKMIFTFAQIIEFSLVCRLQLVRCSTAPTPAVSSQPQWLRPASTLWRLVISFVMTRTPAMDTSTLLPWQRNATLRLLNTTLPATSLPTMLTTTYTKYLAVSQRT